MEKEKTRYNDDELQEFKDIILKKMEIVRWLSNVLFVLVKND